MQPISSSTPATVPAAAPKGVLVSVGNAMRNAGNGAATITDKEGLALDKAAIVPFEAVSTATGALKDATAGVKFLSKITSLFHTIAGFGMLIGAMTVSGIVRAPGAVVNSAAHHTADLIDGQQTADQVAGPYPFT